MQRHQAQALARLRHHAIEHSPFYRERHRGLENAPLHALPVVTKAELMASFDRVLTVPGAAARRRGRGAAIAGNP